MSGGKRTFAAGARTPDALSGTDIFSQAALDVVGWPCSARTSSSRPRLSAMSMVAELIPWVDSCNLRRSLRGHIGQRPIDVSLFTGARRRWSNFLR